MARNPALMGRTEKSEGRQLPAGGQLIRQVELHRVHNYESMPVRGLAVIHNRVSPRNKTPSNLLFRPDFSRPSDT